MSFTGEISPQFDLSFDGWTSFDGVDGKKLWYIHLTMRTSEFLLRNFLEQAKSDILFDDDFSADSQVGGLISNCIKRVYLIH